MVDIFSLTCPSCGGKLQLTPDIERFACGYCGNELLVNRSGGIVSLSPVVAELKGLKQGVDRTASELAIVRLEKEIERLEDQMDEIDPEYLKAPKKFTNSGIFWSGVLLFVIVIIGNINSESGYSSILSCGSFIALGMMVAYITNRGKRLNYRKYSKYYNELEVELDNKVKALARHREIVAE